MCGCVLGVIDGDWLGSAWDWWYSLNKGTMLTMGYLILLVTTSFPYNPESINKKKHSPKLATP